MFVRSGNGGGGSSTGNGYWMAYITALAGCPLYLNGDLKKTFSGSSTQTYDDDNVSITWKGNYNRIDVTFKKACLDYRSISNAVSRTAGTTLTNQDAYNNGPFYFVFT